MHGFEFGWAWGMHVLWWLFWIVLIAGCFTLFVPRRRGSPRETPLERLRRRYAQGEISTEEYEERRKRLEEDATRT